MSIYAIAYNNVAPSVRPLVASETKDGALRTGAMGPEMTVEALRNYIAGLLDVNLLGEPVDPLQTRSSSDNPEAEVTTQKQLLCGKPRPLTYTCCTAVHPALVNHDAVFLPF
jgi:hypothetical protein